MHSTRIYLLLFLIWTASCDARRVKARKAGELKVYEQAEHETISNVSAVVRANNQTQILCFGLCIAGVGLLFLLSVTSATTVTIGYTAKAVLEHLKEQRVEANQIMGTVNLAASWAMVPFEKITNELDRVRREAVTSVLWTTEGLLEHIASTCGNFMEPKGLGESATSSKSGAVFFNCQDPEPTHEYPRMLVKGAIRDSDSSPEWPMFQALAQDLALQARYSGQTLLNRMVLGLDAYDLHWIVLEDIKATRVLYQLKAKLGLAVLNKAGNREETEMPKFDVYDIKPAGNRAPQLPKCSQRLEALAQVMGAIHEFRGWDKIVTTLALDLAVLETKQIIDESLFVQVAGPFNVDEEWARKAETEKRETEILKVIQGTPMCAYQINGRKMAIVCVSILDYVLSMTFMKSVQNVFQFSRWNDYEDKMRTLLSCLGDLSQDGCTDFRAMANGEWLEVVKAEYAEHYQAPAVKNAMDHLESNYRCCCNEEETEGRLTMATACSWLRRADQTTAFGFCPSGLQHYSAADGGCMDVEPPPVPPPEPKTRCSWYQSCCCSDQDWRPHDILPVEENGFCGCHFSCPASLGEYGATAYCPVAYKDLREKPKGNYTSKGQFVRM